MKCECEWECYYYISLLIAIDDHIITILITNIININIIIIIINFITITITITFTDIDNVIGNLLPLQY